METSANSLLWRPTLEQIQQSNLTQFVQYLQRMHPNVPEQYEDLHRWSVEHKERFWQAVWDYFDVQGRYDPHQLFQQADTMQETRWFPGARLNFAENLLRHQEEHLALIECTEDGRRRTLTYTQLRKQVSQLASALRSAGVCAGDRVAAFLPNCADAVIAMLATTSLGAVWTSCSPDFGLQGVMDRFGQIQPKVLFATNGYRYIGKLIDTRDRVRQIADRLPGLKKVVVVPYVAELPVDNDRRQVQLADFLDPGADALEFTQVDFSAPLYIMYSSGTTGVPKCIVHSVGGTLLQHLKEHALHTDLKPNDTLFYYTTCGWMMWNWLVSGLALGATLVLYDGSPFHPGPQALFDLIDQEGISIFGSSAKFYAACEKAGLEPRNSHRLTTLRTLLSTGSPLAPQSFDYIYQNLKPEVCLSSISGGTDIISCFALGNPTLPVYRGELQCIGLGMDVAFYDDQGQELATGKGELVCRSPFPSMPVGFWNDDSGEKYRDAYFERFPGVWAHGDFGEILRHSGDGTVPRQRGVMIHGRSDAVLNPGGVRIGTAELYRQVEQFDDVLEALAVGQEWDNDVRILLFLKMKPGMLLTEALKDRIKAAIRANTTARHVPAKILQVPDIPRTISGKIVELAVRQIIHGREVKNRDALANPDALNYFSDLSEISD